MQEVEVVIKFLRSRSAGCTIFKLKCPNEVTTLSGIVIAGGIGCA